MADKIIIQTESGSLVANYGSVTAPGAVATPVSENIQQQLNFISQELIGGIGSLVEKGHWLAADVLITAGIEFLGACFDNYPMHEKGLSEKRFLYAISALFQKIDPRYQIHKDKLYGEFRCGLNHVLIPTENILFGVVNHYQSSIEKATAAHLTLDKDKRLVLVLENFYADFKKACEMVLNMIKDGKITPKFFIIGPT